MQNKPNDLLLLAGQVLAIFLQIAIAIGALALVIALPLVLFFQGEINAELVKEFEGAVGAFPLAAVMGAIALALIAIGLAFVFFGKLRAIIATVGEGDPFAPENADRLSIMAWLLLAIQIIAIPLGGLGLLIARWAEPLENAEINIDAGMDLTSILMVIILFILARVFRHGAAMREDLEGTV